MIGFLKARHAMAGSLLTLAIKAGGAVLMVLVFILAARTMGPAEFGHLAVEFNALSFLSVVAILGQDTLFVRSWGEYFGRDDGLARGAFWFGWRVVAGSTAVACAGVAIAAAAGPWPISRSEIAACCIFLAAQIILQYSSNTCRHILNFVVSETNRELTWRLVLLASVLAAIGLGLRRDMFFLAAAAGMLLAIGIETGALRRGFPIAVAKAPLAFRVGAWLTRARSMWMSAGIEAAAQYAEVMLLGLIVSPAEAGAYFVAARVANIFTMLGTGLHTYTVSYAANLYFNRDLGRLQAILRSVMSVALAIATPLLLLIAFGGATILGLFGSHYVNEAGTLLLLSGAAYVAALAGPSSGILQITGHERLYSRVILCALAIRLALLLWLAPRYGAFGAALGWAAVNTPVAVGLSAACRSLCGVDASVLSILAKPAPGALSDPA